MKKIIISFILMVLLLPLKAQTIHWMVFCDTDAPGIGGGCRGDGEAFLGHFADEVNASLVSKGYNSSLIKKYSNECTPANCRAVINNLTVGSDDIIVFFYSGHGGRPLSGSDYASEHPFPQMCLASHVESDFVAQEWAYNTLKNKGARLTVVITDCCNSMDPRISRKNVCPTVCNKGAAKVSQQKQKILQNLFLGYRGGVNATSSSPGQYSGGGSDISAYTGGFIDVYDLLDEVDDTNISWDRFLKSVNNHVNDTEEDQTPFHVTSLSACTIPPDRPHNGGGNNNRGNDGENWFSNMTNNLCALCNVTNGTSDRISRERSLNNLFADNAVVRMLAQDSETVIDKELAEDFLGRLATSRLLLSVSVVGGSKNSQGKITDLRVREVYKK